MRVHGGVPPLAAAGILALMVAAFSLFPGTFALAVAWLGLDIRAATGLSLDVATISILRDGDHGRVLQLWNAP